MAGDPALLEYPSVADESLDTITSESIAGYAQRATQCQAGPFDRCSGVVFLWVVLSSTPICDVQSRIMDRAVNS
jgi:hypothetical protein